MKKDPSSKVVFSSISAEEIAPPHYDSKIFSYRYKNGARADDLEEFSYIRAQIEQTLRKAPSTAESLSAQLNIDLSKTQRILDYLFTHSGEVAAFDMPQRKTFYFWAEAQAIEETRGKLALGELTVDPEHLTPDDITAINSYLTNLLILKPSVLMLDEAIENTRESLDLAKTLLKLQPESDTQLRVLLLERKLEQLISRREQESARWGDTQSDAPSPAISPEPEREVMEPKPEEHAPAKPKYPFETAYLLGRLYNYTGPERDKRFNVESKNLAQYDFSGVRKVVIELDTFVHELENAENISHFVDLYRGSIFRNPSINIVFRRVSSIKYKPKVARRLHREVVSILDRGWQIIDM